MIFSSKFFIPFKRQVGGDSIKSHQLLLRCGMISKVGLGLFTWLPLGYRVLMKVEKIISKFHDKIGFNKICMPILQPVSLWQESNRYNAYGQEMMRLNDRHDRELILGPTAEEMFVDAIRQNVSSPKDLPVNLYNIQWKFRDEVRPRFGVMRSREFLMCDGYSAHLTETEAEMFYQEALSGYQEMFEALGFDSEPVEQLDTGEIGGKISHEFFAKQSTVNNEKIELGHIFLFGTKYSESMKFSVRHNNLDVFPFMGSYGVGVSRLIASYAEIFGDENGIKWPRDVAPFYITLIGSNDSLDLCMQIHRLWYQEIYYDDKDTTFGEKLKVSQLIGSPYRIIAGAKEVQNGYVLLNDEKVSVDQIIQRVKSIRDTSI